MGAIVEYSGLGNGFKIAMRDLEIRGAGSVFGAEQSGHIESVGYSMYLTLLNDAIKEINGENARLISDVKIDCYFDANLPNYYISGSSARISAYSEVSKLNTLKGLTELVEKFEESFGTIPTEFKNLMYIAIIKNLTKTLNVKKVSIALTETKILFNDSSENSLKIASEIYSNNIKTTKLSLENGVLIKINNVSSVENACNNIINILNNFNNN